MFIVIDVTAVSADAVIITTVNIVRTACVCVHFEYTPNDE